MCLQEIFILGKQSLWVGLYCNNHSSQHKLNTSFSICFYLPSSWASFVSSIWMSGVRWTHLSLKQWKSPRLELSQEHSPIGLLPWAPGEPTGACDRRRFPGLHFMTFILHHPDSLPCFTLKCPLPCYLAPGLLNIPAGSAIICVMTSPAHFLTLMYPCT